MNRLSRAMLTLGALWCVAAGCSESPPREWVTDLRVQDRDGRPLDSFSAPANGRIEAVILYRPADPLPVSEIDGIEVRPPSQWRARLEVLNDRDEFGWELLPTNTGLDPELNPFTHLGVEFYPAPGGAGSASFGSPTWISPEGPDVPDGTRAYWVRICVPMEPGDYRLALRLYPTAPGQRQELSAAHVRSPINLREFRLTVGPGEPADTKLMAAMYDLEGMRQTRQQVLRMYDKLKQHQK